jgi:predicted enzyme related to lactoylglutathione lyase
MTLPRSILVSLLTVFCCIRMAPAAESGSDPGVSRVVRVNLITADLHRLSEFYLRALNFTIEFEGVVGKGTLSDVIARQWHLDEGAKLYTIVLRAPDGETRVGLTGVQGQHLGTLSRSPDEAPRGGDHYMILRVNNLAALAVKLKSMGVRVWRPLMQVTGGEEMGIFDPDGTRLIIEEGAA